jgi:hypothetical protein
VPDEIEGDGFLQIGPDLLLQQLAWQGFFEWLRRSNLVGVVDALDRLLGRNPRLERQGVTFRTPRRTDQGKEYQKANDVPGPRVGGERWYGGLSVATRKPVPS